jgi:hypothetical protein
LLQPQASEMFTQTIEDVTRSMESGDADAYVNNLKKL